MNRQQAKELLPIIEAFAEGKIIQSTWSDGTWNDIDNEDFDNLLKLIKFGQVLRVKPEPKYRPFKDAKECWNEMLKHQPFGWVKDKNVKDDYYIIDGVYYSESFDYDVASMASGAFSYKELVDNYLFADGTPFGIKE